MTSTIKISDKAKTQMVKLIHYIRLKTNKQLSQQELLDLIIDASIKRKDELFKHLTKQTEERDWRDDPIFTDVDLNLDEDTSEQVDAILYGEEQ